MYALAEQAWQEHGLGLPCTSPLTGLARPLASHTSSALPRSGMSLPEVFFSFAVAISSNPLSESAEVSHDLTLRIFGC